MGFIKYGILAFVLGFSGVYAFAANQVTFADGSAQVECKSLDSIAKSDPDRAADIVDNTVVVVYKTGELVTYTRAEVAHQGFIYRGAKSVAHCQLARN